MNQKPRSISKTRQHSHPPQADSHFSRAACLPTPRCPRRSSPLRLPFASQPPKTVDTRRLQTRSSTKCSIRLTECKLHPLERDSVTSAEAQIPDPSSTSPQSLPSLPPDMDMTTPRFPARNPRRLSFTRRSSHLLSRVSIPRARTARDGQATIACAGLLNLA